VVADAATQEPASLSLQALSAGRPEMTATCQNTAQERVPTALQTTQFVMVKNAEMTDATKATAEAEKEPAELYSVNNQ
jgi:hypothetical protein